MEKEVYDGRKCIVTAVPFEGIAEEPFLSLVDEKTPWEFSERVHRLTSVLKLRQHSFVLPWISCQNVTYPTISLCSPVMIGQEAYPSYTALGRLPFMRERILWTTTGACQRKFT